MEERALVAKETAWQGRAGTMESSGQGFEKESIRLRNNSLKTGGGNANHNNPNAATLPPLSHGGAEPGAQALSYSRGNSAPDMGNADNGLGATAPPAVQMSGVQDMHNYSEKSDTVVMEAISKARSRQNKAKKASKTEMNLFNSPFAQPMLNDADRSTMNQLSSPDAH